MRWLFLFLFFLVSLGPSEAQTCRDYLTGKTNANPEIRPFGGKNPTSPVTRVANWMLAYVPKSGERVQMALPVSLSVNPNQPQQFGDGVQNANLTFGQFTSPPFLSLLTRRAKNATLTLRLFRDFPGFSGVKSIEVRIAGDRKNVAVDGEGIAEFAVDPEALGWNTQFTAETVFFRPAGWQDWFSVQFPESYFPMETFLRGVAQKYQKLPSGESILDPLELKGAADPELALKQKSPDLGFQFASVGPRVHGFYLDPSGRETLTSTGTALTRYRLPEPGFFKFIYVLQMGRDLDREAAEGLVSGTGPHQIGAPAAAEIIVNSLGSEPVMTFYGFRAPLSGPDGERLAWSSEFTHLYLGNWLRSREVFSAPQWTFHQHPTHTIGRPVFAQVLTPPAIPSAGNPFGLSE